MSVVRVATAFFAAIAGALFMLVLAATPASAHCVTSQDAEGNPVLDCKHGEHGVEVTPGNPGGNGGGGEPTCDLVAPYDEICLGDLACWMNDPAANKPEDLEGELGPKPDEDSHVIYYSCEDGSDRWVWSGNAPTISLEDRIIAARSVLQLPPITASFNPPGFTLVNLDTWWWAEGAPTAAITGPPALGVRAVAAPESMSVDPGDGSGTIACPVSAVKSDTCVARYRRSGTYTATITIVYSLTFLQGGNEIDVPSVDGSLLEISSSDTVEVDVREVQSRVTEVG